LHPSKKPFLKIIFHFLSFHLVGRLGVTAHLSDDELQFAMRE
jgi:hypothetical protein